MKCIVLAVLSYAIVLEAYPFDGFGSVGKGIGSGIGGGLGIGVGTGVGLGINGAEAIGIGAIGLGLDAAKLGSGVVEGVGSGFSKGLGAGLGLAGIGVGAQVGNNRSPQRGQPGYRPGYNNVGPRQNTGPY